MTGQIYLQFKVQNVTIIDRKVDADNKKFRKKIFSEIKLCFDVSNGRLWFHMEEMKLCFDIV